MRIASPCIKEAEELTKEIEGRNIRITLGQKAAQQFFRAHRLRSENYSATLAPVIQKVIVRTTGSTDDATVDEDEEKPHKKRAFKQNGNSKKGHAGKYQKKKPIGPRSKAPKTAGEEPEGEDDD